MIILGSIQEHGGSTYLELSRKDSLSLNVEFIRVNICRSRKMEVRLEPSQSKSESHIRSNMVHFSGGVFVVVVVVFGRSS